MTKQKSLTVDDFAALFGTSASKLPNACLDRIAKGNWQYQPIEGEELRALQSQLEERIRLENFSTVVLGDKSRWVRGWSENLLDFVQREGDVAALDPKYIRPNVPVRLFRRFVLPSEPYFELKWYRIFQQWLFRTYLAEANMIFEFGSGSGINVGTLAQLFPRKKIIGLDWAEPAVEIVNNMARLRGWNTEGRVFNFFDPDYSIDVPTDSAVLTMVALEQTSTQFHEFIDFLLAKRPKLCVFIEPIYEWYDPSDPIDHLAIRAHEKRSFLRGLVPKLHQLSEQSRIEILKEKRSDFGSLLHEGYSQIIWRPL